MNWDDARFVLTLARKRSYRDAARSLRVNHTTVSRRIMELEKRLSAHLFERTPAGYITTSSGKIICEAAERMEDLLAGSMKRIEGSDFELSGDIHVHIPDIFNKWVCEKLTLLLIQYPKLNIRLSSETTMANLAKREADIALRFTQLPPLGMVGRKVSQIPMAVYASIDYEIKPAQSLYNYPWVRWSETYSDSRVEQWTEGACVGAPNIMRVNTYEALTLMIRNGAGIGCLSPWFADKDLKLKRISPIIDEASMDIWVLIHPDLRGVKRIKIIKDSLASIFRNT